ncbi:MAG: glycosyltransferase family 4 protein, partial [Anaerolineae bacterium]|nr:glycosyltransferase family 4 protein [Anaerolineae bacterium]
VQVGLFKEDNLLYRFFLRLEKMVYTLADHLTVITPQFKKSILSKGVPLEKVSVIPNFVALDFDSLQPPQSDKYVVLYAGNIGMTQSFETIIEVIQRLHNEPGIHFLIVGDGVKRKYVESQVKNCPNVTMLPYQPLEVIPSVYKSADLGLVPLKTGTAKTTIPSKIYTIMGAGLPVLLSVDLDSDMIGLMQEADCGLSIPPDNADAMEAALRQIYRERERFKQLGLKGQQFVEKTYSRQSVARQYDALIRKLTAS